MSDDRGIVTVAVRQRMYLETAVDLALSVGEVDPQPVTLLADQERAERARRRFEGVFDEIREIPDRYLFGRAFKLGAAELTPYERTLLIDADSLLLRPLDELWARLAPLGFAMIGGVVEGDSELRHHERTVREWCAEFELDRYFKSSATVQYFERGRGREVHRAVFEAYRDRVHRPPRWDGEEVAFGIVGADGSIPSIPPPTPILWPGEMNTLDPDAPSVPILTFIGAPPPPVLDRLISDARRRRREAGLPEAPVQYLRLKATSSNAGFWANALRPVRRAWLDWWLPG